MNEGAKIGCVFAGCAAVLLSLMVVMAWIEDRRQERIVRIVEMAVGAESDASRDVAKEAAGRLK